MGEQFTRKLKVMKKNYLSQGNEEKFTFPQTPIEVNSENFFEFIESYPITVVDFWAPWCNPCKSLAPIIKSLAKELKGKVVFGKLNVDKNKNIAEMFSVANIPTLLIFKGNKVIDRLVGVYTKKMLLEKLSKYI